MTLDDLPPGALPAEPAVPRVDRGAPSAHKVTRAEELRLQLADEIVRGALPPGAPLDETDIARRFSVSRTPVREALRQLVASGLVEARAHRGAVVAQPSFERLTGMFEAMAELEALCAGLAAERMSATERHGLEAIHEELRVLSYAGNPERFHEVNERFHNAIYAGSQNGYIAEITLWRRACAYSRFAAPSSAISAVSPSRKPSTTALSSPSCAATSRAPPPRCARISSWCAGSTRSTRCRFRGARTVA
ncbi:DNA-binding GntR family transcriptional regulator [Bradyrhizobium sp. GM22.5]